MIFEFSELKFLIVEDNDHAMRLIKMVLRDLGVSQIYTTRNGVEALDFLSKFGKLVDLVISDWNMPQMSGIELFMKVRETQPELPFLMLTARNTLESVREARDRGLKYYIAKPFAPDVLERKICSMFRNMRQEASRTVQARG